ncbi:MAG: hypothetical protein V7K15_15780 [Nostoc sp.]
MTRSHECAAWRNQVESPTSILLLTIYSKSDREDIDLNEIRDILTDFSSESG